MLKNYNKQKIQQVFLKPISLATTVENIMDEERNRTQGIYIHLLTESERDYYISRII